MLEVKARVKMLRSVIEQADVDDDPGNLVLLGEIAYLQIRKICELVASATLCAHNELPVAQSVNLMERYNAEAIFARLRHINDIGFPHAVENTDNGFNLITVGRLDRKELVRTYTDCHEFLHSGTLIDIIGNQRRKIDFNIITNLYNRFVELLSYHAVPVLEAGSVMFCCLADSDGGDGVTVEFKRSHPLDG